jgi:hypothetical protein
LAVHRQDDVEQDPWYPVRGLSLMSRKAGHQEIDSSALERAEKILSATYNLVVGPDAGTRLAARARINPLAMDAFINHHRAILFKEYLPDIDPRHEAAINTMLVHMLCVGAVAQRVSEGRS